MLKENNYILCSSRENRTPPTSYGELMLLFGHSIHAKIGLRCISEAKKTLYMYENGRVKFDAIQMSIKPVYTYIDEISLGAL